MKREIKFTTNTAYLLNMWIKKTCIFPGIYKFVQHMHDRAWKYKSTTNTIEVTIKLK